MGMPVMIKAAAGGGGRGMRRVTDPEQLLQSIALARSEAEGAFGNGDLILERAIEGARHVEVQVFADTHGNVIHLGERDCSLQRRHQKVVEESPCPVMTPELREAMGTAAVEAARAVSYVGAGTVEFLLDASGEFYFLEMNTRLQVEHPVTECVTGLDLVQWQIRVAQGERLPATQDDIDLFGHAIEVRLCAEDPAAAFYPALVPYRYLACHRGGVRGSRDETGDAISPFYDSMVAKVIAWGETRETARLKLRSALQATALAGVTHNRAFLLELLDRPTFIEGGATTDYIDQHYPGYSPAQPSTASLAAASCSNRFSRPSGTSLARCQRTKAAGLGIDGACDETAYLRSGGCCLHRGDHFDQRRAVFGDADGRDPHGHTANARRRPRCVFD